MGTTREKPNKRYRMPWRDSLRVPTPTQRSSGRSKSRASDRIPKAPHRTATASTAKKQPEPGRTPCATLATSRIARALSAIYPTETMCKKS